MNRRTFLPLLLPGATSLRLSAVQRGTACSHRPEGIRAAIPISRWRQSGCRAQSHGRGKGVVRGAKAAAGRL